MGNILLTASTDNLLAGLKSAWDSGETVSWIVASNYVAPAIFFALLIALVFTLGRTGFGWNQMHSQWEAESMKIIILIIVMAIVGSFWGWGAVMLGKKSSKNTACVTQQEIYIPERDEIIWTQL